MSDNAGVFANRGADFFRESLDFRVVLAFDHRAFDGAYASAFMAAVKEILETRDWSAEL